MSDPKEIIRDYQLLKSAVESFLSAAATGPLVIDSITCRLKGERLEGVGLASVLAAVQARAAVILTASVPEAKHTLRLALDQARPIAQEIVGAPDPEMTRPA